ncbi:hypothetical protein [Vitiosangium sp. GDMCC 1.1324]|uniref:hypothetical protein n=1 Tax=Vitiosangium sp. (strain GDMCC 1.1324) TaxID=2138576 RepID=UPI000D491DF4|nr:hypothetical protein [Vitiosangium sp. GDMCC 1.1324]PTL75654.1 hypothetical protein DAT35_53510 [Vitiosangium sp. GDMCC 1.1324]
MTVSTAQAAVPAKRIITTDDAVYFEPSDPSQSDIIWVYPKTKTTLKRYELDPSYLQADRVLRDVTLPANPGEIHPSWEGKQALFYQTVSQNECVLNRTTAMRFVQQFVTAKGITIHGTKRTPICTFTFQLRNETPAMVAELEAAAAAGTLITHVFGLDFSVAALAPIPWNSVHAGLVAGGVSAGSPRSSELAAFELGLVDAVVPVARLSAEARRSFLNAALQTLFGWDQVAPEVQLVATAPAGQYDFPGQTQNVPL